MYPYWTTKEILKLIDAVKGYGEDWQKISTELFDMKRSPKSLQKKWETIFQKDKKYDRNVFNSNKSNKFQKQNNTSRTGNLEKVMNKDQLACEFGRKLSLQWSSIINLFGQQVESVEIHFKNQSDYSRI